MMVNDEHYTLLIKLLCAAVPYAVPYDGQDEHCILFSDSVRAAVPFIYAEHILSFIVRC